MCPKVPFQLTGRRECHTACLTEIIFRMCQPVPFQFLGRQEQLATCLTEIPFRMCQSVLFQFLGRPEPLATCLTDIRILTGVRTHVCIQVAFSREPLTTCLTYVNFLVILHVLILDVEYLVCAKSTGRSELHITCLADVLYPFMFIHMYTQKMSGFKIITTYVADKTTTPPILLVPLRMLY